ncbi:carboxypeptidase-like regulatory domain-containing protein [Allomuricauda sp. SCSIO 65647]|uniref:carboxypeptidase-like regulatory domain-containing protein n=1 Tax=Allomuricauda sp. SCSIO 65647 TaxID=2908843 RepID=UPI001F35F652|nr:carboxypeptidase-like regulatory domain-containing protein [Muricauda sp. SCSIO 65647]UJH68150.1 carboxypeptidase-like regulatory domain-containing protein [Muricauda sp. SCSIO 65647]
MKFSALFALFVLVTTLSFSQDDSREILRGQVLYRGNNVENENVINSTTGFATITDENGRFLIRVKAGDQLVFTAVNYQLEIVQITQEIIENRRLVVEVTEKVTELDEVVVTPEDQERFLEVKNEDFKQFDYEIDRTTEVENIAESQSVRGMRDGLNVANVFRALFKAVKNGGDVGRPPLKVSDVLRQVYDDEFFVADLRLPQDKIDAFLVYCDDRIPSEALLRKENEFQLIDFLVTQSKNFLKQLNEE